MGILDKKTRFIDLVVTQEGKRQMASGKLRAEFASLSDCNTFYSKGDHEDVSERLFFEVMERPENMIVMEKDDSGRLIPINFSPTGSIVGNDIFEGTIVNDVVKMLFATGSQYNSSESAILDSSLRHFKNNFLIGTKNYETDSDQFELSQKNIEFIITNKFPFPTGPHRERININNCEPFFLDPKLTHLPNFKFLPPINTDGSNYGIYTDIRSTSKETWNDIQERIGYDVYSNLNDNINLNENILKNKIGNYQQSRKLLIDNELPIQLPPKKEHKTINFLKTSDENNLMIQFFEDSLGPTMTKLDIIDAGEFIVENDPNEKYTKHVFYIGKIFFDDYNTPTFVNIFTLIAD